jgi:EF-P beta-lysylation protein EpmB
VQLPNPIALFDKDWQSQLRDVITSRGELLDALGLREEDVGCAGGEGDLPLKVPVGFVGRMKAQDPRDPLLLQVLSSALEAAAVPGYVRDPLAETGGTIPRRGLVHKYHGRVLLIVTGGCAVHCRYCFRRHFPYSDNRNNRRQWHEALRYIEADNSIEEVILSGGDPLVATDSHLDELVRQVAAIAHVKRLRIHSRLPIVIPARITDGLLAAITQTRLQTVMVVHCNHANEIDGAVARSLATLGNHGITTLNQAVLLRGVNDNVGAQIGLSEALFAAGVLPYYLHLLDRVQGAAHFDVPEGEARALLDRVAAGLPGYLVPKLVREVAGAGAKLAV